MIRNRWLRYEQEIVLVDAVDLFTPASYGSFMRSRLFAESGMFRLARRDATLYSVMIEAGGSWGRILIYDGTGREIFYQPSTFTGSFVLEAGCKDGIICHFNAGDGSDALITVNWRERDDQLV